MRERSFVANYLNNPYSSVLSVSGNTKVITALSLDMKVPPHVKSGGWLTAEYSLLPGSTNVRSARERTKISGRTAEIQRLIGRSLRMAVDLEKIPGITMLIDCDVLEADGGTRTASVNGGMLAVALACRKLVEEGVVSENPLKNWIGAISGGVIDGEVVIDLDYEKDSRADTDFNFVFSENGNIIELQGTAERVPLDEDRFFELLKESRKCVKEIIEEMKSVAGF
ncbi:ribonuclease PH [bacterium]|nr:ribonuclease PH [bacterium]